MPNRLTKASLRTFCESEIRYWCERHQIDLKQGAWQLDGRPQLVIIAWGKIDAYRIIMENFCVK